MDIVAIGKSPGELQLYENDDASWSLRNLKQDFLGGWALAKDDLDGDGDIDVVAGASALGVLSWWENDSVVVPVQVTSFTAEPSPSGVRLTWEVFHDEIIKGIRIYKRQEQDIEFCSVGSGTLIPEMQISYTDEDVLPGRIYHYCLAVVKEDGSETRSRILAVKTKTISMSLCQNRPNPFNPLTTISFSLAERTHANLSIYDVNGILVRTLRNEIFGEGHHEVTWDGKDTRGVSVGSGVYFYRLRAGKSTLTRKMILLE